MDLRHTGWSEVHKSLPYVMTCSALQANFCSSLRRDAVPRRCCCAVFDTQHILLALQLGLSSVEYRR